MQAITSFSHVSPLLTLSKINNSQEEMSYITRMRNETFSVKSGEDEENIEHNPFEHNILCPLSRMPYLDICLRHALSKIGMCHAFVQNNRLFRQRRTNIDNDFFQGENTDQYIHREELDRRVTEYGPTERNSAVGFITNSLRYSFDSGWVSWSMLRRLFRDNQLDKIQTNTSVDYLNSLYKSTWRRVYADNYTMFSCSDTAIAAYVKEQLQTRKQVHIVNHIMKRERGERVNNFKVLESLASSFYYVLPHQNEGDYNRINFIIRSCAIASLLGRNYQTYEIFHFESGVLHF
ncbi:uncharacterized protein NPIL_154111 [Nephila pilipes]|uniref:Uncharacterized protein n=1 Tax=Nephila pilipes TaxID=299642 RepID=A0A8X6MMJ8_NEPPI|nr:uncharacterized protein NPIL_154111 [Nephila pilipes]